MNAPSLRARLTALIIAVQLCVLVPFGVLGYQREASDIDKLLDARLAQAGRTLGMLLSTHLPAKPDGMTPKDVAAATSGLMVRVHQRTYESEVGFQAYDASGRLLAATANMVELPAPAADERGFRNVRLSDEQWRLFTLQNRAGLVIRIGERYDSRRDITRSLILEHSLLTLIGLPLLTLLASFVVKRGLHPLAQLTRMLAQRTPGSRRPIAISRTPLEIQPLIATLNQQLERLEDAIEREHRFAGDVAHELRTPLAAAMIHLESAQLASDPQDAAFTLQQAQQSLARLARRIEQILALARLEAGAASQQRVRLDLVAIATEVIEELAPTILEKDAVLSFDCEPPRLFVLGHEVALGAMFRNLIENALRYAARGGQVEVALRRDGGEAVIEVSDNGPGIPAERRAVVFERFHRENRQPSVGYGLGLNIVKRAAELHDAGIELLDLPAGHGLRVRIAMPLAPDA